MDTLTCFNEMKKMKKMNENVKILSAFENRLRAGFV